jgi:hypothetical protein
LFFIYNKKPKMDKENIVSRIKNILKESKIRLREEEDKYALTPEEMEEVKAAAKKMVDDTFQNMQESKAEVEEYIRRLKMATTDHLDAESKKRIDEFLADELSGAEKKLEDYTRWLDEFNYDEAFNHALDMQMTSAYGKGFQIRQDKYRKEQLNRKLTQQDIIDLFITALEGGSNYWYLIRHLPDSVRYEIKNNNKSTADAVGEYVLSGGEVYFYDREDKDELLGKVDMNSILDAITEIKTKYPDVWERILTEEYDADDADVFLQICVMGEIVFG